MKTKSLGKDCFFSRTLSFFTTYLDKQLGKSPETIRSYTDSLSAFRRYVVNERKISIMKFQFKDCTKDFLLDFIAYLKDNGNGISTYNVRLSAIKTYVQYCADNDVSLESVALNISKVRSQKVPKREKNLLVEEDLEALLAQPPATRFGIRDRTILILLYDAAVRVQELTNLHLDDINFEALCIHVYGKGRKERDVAISKNTATHLRKYINLYHSCSAENPEGWLFYTVIKGKLDHISTATIRRIVRKYSDELRDQGRKFPERVYPHLLRAERATNLYQEGVDPLMIATFLGHEQIETTRIYALPSIDKMREAMERVQPAPTADMEDIAPIANDEEAMARLCGLR